jgi:hypothetical protein
MHSLLPALTRARAIEESDELGRPASMQATYPLWMAPAEQRAAPRQPPINLDLCHPAPAIQGLMDDIESVCLARV